MNWNIMNSSKFKANATELPNLSVKPYFQYGLGLQKTVNDNFTAFVQVMLRNGGQRYCRKCRIEIPHHLMIVLWSKESTKTIATQDASAS